MVPAIPNSRRQDRAVPVREPHVQHETADRCRESIRATGRASARLVAMFHVKHPEDAVSESAWPRNPCPKLLFLDERRGSFLRRGSGIQTLCRCRRTDSISFQHLNRRESAEISPGVSRRERDEIPRHMIPLPGDSQEGCRSSPMPPHRRRKSGRSAFRMFHQSSALALSKPRVQPGQSRERLSPATRCFT